MIAKVEQPTECCVDMVAVLKQDGEIRICVDLAKLNESVRRERHPLPAVDQVLAKLASAKVFSKLDTNSGFWQIALDPESFLPTKFITPFGCYCFCHLRLAFHWHQNLLSDSVRVSEGLSGALCMIDDTLIYGKTWEEHDK